MKHEDTHTETINQQVKRMNAAAHCIENTYNEMKKERDDTIKFLRSFLEKDLTVIHDSIRDYLDDYDTPF